MINLDDEKLILLIDEEVLGHYVQKHAVELIKLCKKVHPRASNARGSHRVNHSYRFFEQHGTKFLLNVDLQKLQILLSTLFRGGKRNSRDELYYLATGKRDLKYVELTVNSLQSFTRLLFIKLWLAKVVVLPLKTACAVPWIDILEKLITEFGHKIANKIWAVNPRSSYHYKGDLSIKERELRHAHWFRLLFNTSFYTANSVTKTDIQKINANGTGHKAILARYYPLDFLEYVAEDSTKASTTLNELYSLKSDIKQKTKKANMLNRKKAPTPTKWFESYTIHWDLEEFKKEIVRDKSSIPKTIFCLYSVLAYALAEDGASSSITDLFDEVVVTNNIRLIYFDEKLNVKAHTLYSQLPEMVSSFCQLFFDAFTAMVKSKRLQREGSYFFMLSLTLSYLATYLPRFYLDRDGNLDKYPATFNDFSCSYFISRDEFLEKVMLSDEEHPMPLFKYLEEFGKQNEWGQSSLYARLVVIRSFAEFLEERSNIIMNASSFKNTITDADMPRTQRRVTTAKKVIPREYFATLVSLLESLCYLADHLNGMADGINAGLQKGKLEFTSVGELEELFEWKGLWGKEGSIQPEMDLSKLNYTPIYSYNAKYYPLRRCLRFYSLASYKINGLLCTRVAPNHVRTTLLMAQTGIRQMHLLWLDKDRFDEAVSHHSNSALVPLVVSTDKAHGEWVSVVTRNVIDICLKQKEWYEKCELDSFNEDLWYGFKKGSKFGQFKPLFRIDSTNTWDNLIHFPRILWTLQHIIKNELGDLTLPDLVSWVPTEARKFEGSRYDLALSDEEYSKGTHDASWRYRLYSQYTPHGLRAAFVSDAIRFLPPSLIGQYLTGQTENLVWYYTILESGDIGNHKELLLNLLKKNSDDIEMGNAPELAQHIASINTKLAIDIESDVSAAIGANHLVSLTGVAKEKNGIELLKSKKYAKLAYNSTHICPFDNTCPKEVIELLGINTPCALCPYAIRGVSHLPAINALKFKNIELMQEYLTKIKSYKGFKMTNILQGELTLLERSHDHVAREAATLEAIEQQLFHIHEAGSDNLIVQDRNTLVQHYAAINLDETEHVFKRLCDAQAFPDFDSKVMQRKFAYLRQKLLVADGNISGLLEAPDEPEHVMLASLIKSMMSAQKLGVKEIFKIASSSPDNSQSRKNVMETLGLTQGVCDE
ncbi:MAG: hypothetical protein ACI88H_001391 [Cocleimonas sp.]|jgi:hypothetical protein